MNTTYTTLLYTIIILLIGILMLNFKKLFSNNQNDRKTVTEVEKDLIQAIHDDNLNKFKVIFEENNISADKVCYNKKSLLQYSVFFYHGWKFIEYLAEKGCNINKQDSNGKTAMFEAAYLGYIRNVQYLLKYGAKTNIKVKNMFDFDAIEASAFKNKVKVLFLFLKLKIITVEELKKKAEIIESKHKINILNQDLILEIQKFMKIYNRYVGFIRAKRLQEETFYNENIKSTKILAKIPEFYFRDILNNHFVK